MKSLNQGLQRLQVVVQEIYEGETKWKYGK